MTLGLRHYGGAYGFYNLPKQEQLEVLGKYANENTPAPRKGRRWEREDVDATEEARARANAFRVG